MLHSYKGVNLQEVYKTMLSDLLQEGQVIAPRGMETKEFIPAVFQITNPLSRVIALDTRKMNLFYGMIEFLWYMNGDNRVAPLTFYNRHMANFSDDGSVLHGAYGARLVRKRDELNKSQFGLVYDKLKKDPTSRQAVMVIWDPWRDYKSTKDVPCTVNFIFTIREEKLNMTTVMRSNDIVLGITYDVFAFTMFQEFLARKLGVGLGTYTHFANSFHIYDIHYDMASQMINDNTPVKLMPEMPETSWTLFNELYAFAEMLREEQMSIPQAMKEAENYDDYWRQWAYMFAFYKAVKDKDTTNGQKLFGRLTQPYYDMSVRWVEKLV